MLVVALSLAAAGMCLLLLLCIPLVVAAVLATNAKPTPTPTPTPRPSTTPVPTPTTDFATPIPVARAVASGAETTLSNGKNGSCTHFSNNRDASNNACSAEELRKGWSSLPACFKVTTSHSCPPGYKKTGRTCTKDPQAPQTWPRTATTRSSIASNGDAARGDNAITDTATEKGHIQSDNDLYRVQLDSTHTRLMLETADGSFREELCKLSTALPAGAAAPFKLVIESHSGTAGATEATARLVLYHSGQATGLPLCNTLRGKPPFTLGVDHLRRAMLRSAANPDTRVKVPDNWRRDITDDNTKRRPWDEPACG